MKTISVIITLFPIMFYNQLLFSQVIIQNNDKCGYDMLLAKESLEELGDHWGYGYDSLLSDLSRWAESPYVSSIDSIGTSVQGRILWQLTITSPDSGATERQTVIIHARTHPNEVQSWWVTEQIINILLSADNTAELLRQHCVFYIIPMYNPDGVELEFPRENAHGIDIESNWANDPPEPEVAALRKRFSELMSSASPIKIALNMHSAYRCLRYFVYHDQAGTSLAFAALEQTFITGIQKYFPGGIESWDSYISWTSGTPNYYPESWFWLNYQEAVMALTYEDMNCAEAGDFDHTATAILNGIADYLDITNTALRQPANALAKKFQLQQNYPNPFNPSTTIPYSLTERSRVQLNIYDVTGRKLTQLVNAEQGQGDYFIKYNSGQLASGIYIVELKVENQSTTRKIILTR